MPLLNWWRDLVNDSVAHQVNVWISHPVSPSCSFELSSTSRECISRSLCVMVEVVLLDVLDARIAVVARVLINSPRLFS